MNNSDKDALKLIGFYIGAMLLSVAFSVGVTALIIYVSVRILQGMGVI